MKILFLESHPMWILGLPNGFREAGHEVQISGKLTAENIPKLISESKANLAIMIGWTPETTGKKINVIKKHLNNNKIPFVYWATEDPTHTLSFSLPFIQTMSPDFVFTIAQSRIDFYNKLGIKAAHLDFGYDPHIHHPVNVQAEYRSKIAIVANGYSRILKLYPNHYRINSIQTLINPLLNEDIRIDFWGVGWDNMAEYTGKSIPSEWIHGYIPYVDANKVYSSADIVIGLQNQLTQLTQRTYEILGSGGFLLTSETPEVRHLFSPDHDLITSCCSKETLEKVLHFLNAPEERERINRQGQLSVSKHSYYHRAMYMIKVLQEFDIINL